MAHGRWESTARLLAAARRVLMGEFPMTVRQCFYRLVSIDVLKNCQGHYSKVSRLLTEARERGEIAWDWIVDRSRPTYSVSTWDSLEEYGEVVAAAYRKDYWKSQSRYVVIVVEKDSIIGSIQEIGEKYGVPIYALRGFSSATRLHDIADEFRVLAAQDKEIHILYAGDFDPSGMAIEMDVARRIEKFMAIDDRRDSCIASGMGLPDDLGRENWILSYGPRGDPEEAPFQIRRLAIHAEDIRRFKLPPMRVKDTDSQASRFRRNHGVQCVELDALPPSELRRRFSEAIEELIDPAEWGRVLAIEKAERETTRNLAKAFRDLPGASSPSSEGVLA